MFPALCEPRDHGDHGDHGEVGADGGDHGEAGGGGGEAGSCDLLAWNEAQPWPCGRHPGAGLT